LLYIVVTFGQMNTKFSAMRTESGGGYLASLLFTELNRLAARRIGSSAHRGRHADVVHQPYPLANGLRPHFFIGPANLVRPVRDVSEPLGFNADRKRANHLARADAVQRRP